MPAIEATANGESVIVALPIAKLAVSAPSPKAHTRITAATIRFLLFVKSTLFSTTFLTPIAEIIPYKTNDIPPIIQLGIEPIITDTIGKKEMHTANVAAILITLGS